MNVPENVKPLLEKIPAEDYDAGYQVCREILAAGPDAITDLACATGEAFGDNNGVKAKYAVHALACYAARPGGEEKRRLVSKALAKALLRAKSSELKAFIIRQLQLCGTKEAVPFLAGFLLDERLCEPAVQALTAVGGERAAIALRKMLPHLKGKQRAPVIKALGRMRDSVSAPAIRKAAAGSGRDVRVCAFYALGNIGDGKSVDLLLKAADASPSSERDEAFNAALLCGRRLAASGDAKRAGGMVPSSRSARSNGSETAAKRITLKTIRSSGTAS